MFSVRTPKRTYFLVAKNDPDMNKWVNAICQVCGLKAQEEDQQCQSKDINILNIKSNNFYCVFIV